MKGAIKAIVDAYAAAIIKSVMDERGVDATDFRTSLIPRHVKARAAAMRRLSAEGFNTSEIGRAMNMDPSTVRFRLNPDARKRRTAARVARDQRKALARAVRNAAELAI
jgi:hypothetical protein